MSNRKWKVHVMKDGYIYVHAPNEFYVTMGSVVESLEADSKEEAEAIKTKIEEELNA